MILRHEVHLDDGVVAIQYRTDERLLTVGGNGRLLPMLKTLFREYFGIMDDVWDENWIQKNKVRLSVTLDDNTEQRYDVGLESIKDHGLVLKVVTSHGNTMR
jgi:hypothetical protein